DSEGIDEMFEEYVILSLQGQSLARFPPDSDDKESQCQTSERSLRFSVKGAHRFMNALSRLLGKERTR
ncbi:MAG TPA: hypothetical protein VI874_04110, partial [Candidatus Norongarragalinales archaeon]|nr:hypothetical protein [Candidatus Norongarragalinales archaeon]